MLAGWVGKAALGFGIRKIEVAQRCALLAICLTGNAIRFQEVSTPIKGLGCQWWTADSVEIILQD